MLCQQQREQLFWTIKMISSQINGASSMLFNVKNNVFRDSIIYNDRSLN
jgi:hypothetical protein